MSKVIKFKILKDLKQHQFNNSGNLEAKISNEKHKLQQKRKTPDIVHSIMKKSYS
jgi:hypothetical protein